MKAKIVLKTDHDRQRALEVIRALKLDPAMEISVREHKKDRSTSQNNLYWVWVKQISGYTGESKDEVHRRLKKKHLIPIYMEDPDPERNLTATVMAVREVHKQGMKTVAKTLEERIVDLVSTTTATVKQFTEYLEEIEKEAISQGIYLSHPEDMWHEAMGR